MQHIHTRIRTLGAAAVALAVTAGLGACTTSTAEDAGPLVLITHDSFALSEGTLQQFTDETGVQVQVQATSDAGALVNGLVLTADAPLGDVVFGIDNTFASRAVDAGVLEPYVTPDLPDAVTPYLLPSGQGRDELTPIDRGDVCVNVDLEWFAEAGIPVPESLDDLIDPAYRDLTVVEAANSSSPGLAFLLATIAAYGEDGWQEYWGALLDNGVTIAADWTQAYYVEFSGPSSEGDKPIVVSYATSPYVEPEGATGVLAASCFQQVEYAGVIAGTDQPELARKLVDFLYSVTVQEDIPENMYVLPVNPEAALPESWTRELLPAGHVSLTLEPARIVEQREAWIAEWAEIAVP